MMMIERTNSFQNDVAENVGILIYENTLNVEKIYSVELKVSDFIKYPKL